MHKQAKFNIGDLIYHKKQGYRGVIVDVDPLFQASGRYNPQACKRAFAKRHPWYRVLVDGSSQITYVEEPFLETDNSNERIQHPNLNDYLIMKQGHYQSSFTCH